MTIFGFSVAAASKNGGSAGRPGGTAVPAGGATSATSGPVGGAGGVDGGGGGVAGGGAAGGIPEQPAPARHGDGSAGVTAGTVATGTARPGGALLPVELDYHFVDGTLNQVRVHADEPAVLEDWYRAGRVEIMAGGRPFLLTADLEGAGVRVLDPVTGYPLAVFHPDRRGGRVDLADGAALRWLRPRRRALDGAFERGFVGWWDANVLRFAYDGVAIVLVDPSDLVRPTGWVGSRPDFGARTVADPRRGWVPDVLMLLVLGWFLLLLEDDAPVARPARPRRTRPGGHGRDESPAPPMPYPDLAVRPGPDGQGAASPCRHAESDPPCPGCPSM